MNKKYLSVIIMTVIVFSAAAFLSFRSSGSGKKCTVGIANGKGYNVISQNPIKVSKGSSAQFNVELENGWFCDESDPYQVVNGVLTIPSVQTSRTIYFAPRRNCTVSIAEADAPYAELTSSGTVVSGTNATVRFSAPENYVVSAVNVNDERYAVSGGDTLDFPVRDDSVISLEYSGRPMEFSVASGENGGVQIENEQSEYHYGDSIRLSCVYNSADTRFDGWSRNGYVDQGGELLSTDTTVAFQLTEDLALFANYTDLHTYTITIDTNGGTASEAVSLSGCSADHGKSLPVNDGKISRSGYTLMGFNTDPSGNGIHYSPGGLFLMPRNDVTLYAEWEAETSGDLFAYRNDGNALMIDGVNDSYGDKLCIPSQINGIPVLGIGENAFSNDTSLKTLIIPKGVVWIGENAFSGCPNLTTVYLPDTIEKIGDGAFRNTPSFTNFRVLYTYETRVYEDTFEAALAYTYLRLKNTEGKRIIFVAGSSGCFGLNSPMLEERFPDYTAVNFSGSYLFGIQPILQYVLNNIHEGDIVIFAPEYYEEMYANKLTGGVANWQYLESNPDMLNDLDVSDLWPTIFTNYPRFLKEKRSYLPGKQDAGNIYVRRKVNSYGDYYVNRENHAHTALQPVDTSLITAEGIQRFAEVSRMMTDKGVTCLFSFPPVSKSENTEAGVQETYSAFTDALKSALTDTPITLISRAEDYIFNWDLFYDSGYHMTNEGAEIRTKQLITDLEASGLIS